MFLFRKKETIDNSGLIMDVKPKEVERPPFYLLIVKGILLFFLSAGSIGCLLTSFDIPVHEVMFYGLLFLMCMFLSLIFRKVWVKNLGYISVLVIFLYEIIFWGKYVVSGYYGIFNIILSKFGTSLGISSVMTYNEAIADRQTSVTIFLLFASVGMGTLLNSVIQNYMSIGTTIFVTFPFAFLGCYGGYMPSMIPLIMLLTATVVVYAYGHQEIKVRRKVTLNEGNESQPESGKRLLHFLLASGLLVAVFVGALYFVFPNQKIGKIEAFKEVREITDDVVGKVVSSGLMGLFNRYNGAGGMSGGRLGGTSIVSPDFETDLEVKMVPYTYQTVYLKGFTGDEYERNRWTEDQDELTDGWKEREVSQLKIRRKNELRKTSKDKGLDEKSAEENSEEKSSVIEGKIEVKNIDANEYYMYRPYYTKFSDVQTDGGATMLENEQEQSASLMHSGKGLLLNQTQAFSYIAEKNAVLGEMPGEVTMPTKIVSDYDWKASAPKRETKSYREVPKETIPVLKDTLEKAGMTAITEKYKDQSRREKISYMDLFYEQSNALANYFQKHYPYTKRPGNTPWKEDYVTYFLTKQKEGFCAHFASAATLLFRTLGYDARYVEGYAIPFSTVTNGKIVSTDTKEYMGKGQGLKDYNFVYHVAVDDSLAHAWCEVFVPGFGWKVLDVTPASLEEEEEGGAGGFGFLGDFFSSGERGSQEPAGMDGMEFGVNASRYMMVVCILMVFILGFLCWRLGKLLAALRRKRERMNDANRSQALAYRYRLFAAKLRRKEEGFSEMKTQKEQLEWIFDYSHMENNTKSQNMSLFSEEDKEKFLELLQKANFSKVSISETEYQMGLELLQKVKKLLKV